MVNRAHLGHRFLFALCLTDAYIGDFRIEIVKLANLCIVRPVEGQDSWLLNEAR